MNIPNHEGIEAVKSPLNSISQEPIATKGIIKFLFWNSLSARCAIGTTCAPDYANIFMGKFEKKNTFIHTLIYFQTFTANLSIIYSFFRMEP